jgi:hypothetical protein
VSARNAPLLLALLLAGCPLPQPLPDYVPGQPVTPPRVVVDDNVRQVAFAQPIVEVPAGCTTAPTYALSSFLRDANTSETVVGRWFVNYDARVPNNPSVFIQQEDEVPAPVSGDITLRQSGTFTFSPYLWPPAAGTGGGSSAAAGALNVVELVLSNGFDSASGNTSTDRPNRKPLSNLDVQFEVQVYRWVFLTVPPSTATPCP